MARTPSLALALAFLVSAGPAGNACTVVVHEHYLLRDFAIQVYDWRGLPVPAARVHVSPSIHSNPGPEELTATTDAVGIARFRNVPVGAYSATTDMPNGEYVEITVVDSGSMQLVHPDLRLRWPNRDVVSAQRMSGRFASDTPKPLRLALLKADSGEQLESVLTDSEGNFDFSEVPPGLYFIRVSRTFGKSFEGDVPVSIEPTAKNARLDLSIAWSTCGLSYTDNVTCTPSEPLNVANLCGTILDPSGAIVFDAAIHLLAAANEPMPASSLKQKPDGTFAALGISPGQYTLRVSREGFHQLQVPVRVQDGSGSSCVDPLTITLGVFSSCSKAEVRSPK